MSFRIRPKAPLPEVSGPGSPVFLRMGRGRFSVGRWTHDDRAEVGDRNHLKVFANADAAAAWFAENDSEGVAFGYEVIGSPIGINTGWGEQGSGFWHLGLNVRPGDGGPPSSWWLGPLHSEVGNVRHSADRSIGNFNVGRN